MVDIQRCKAMKGNSKPLWNEMGDGSYFCMYCADVFERSDLRTKAFAMAEHGNDRAVVCQDCYEICVNQVSVSEVAKFMSDCLAVTMKVHGERHVS